MYKTSNEKFNMWLEKVNIVVNNTIDAGLYDLMDNLYYDWFESGMSPEKAAEEAIAAEMDGMGLDSSFLF